MGLRILRAHSEGVAPEVNPKLWSLPKSPGQPTLRVRVALKLSPVGTHTPDVFFLVADTGKSPVRLALSYPNLNDGPDPKPQFSVATLPPQEKLAAVAGVQSGPRKAVVMSCAKGPMSLSVAGRVRSPGCNPAQAPLGPGVPPRATHTALS